MAYIFIPHNHDGSFKHDRWRCRECLMCQLRQPLSINNTEGLKSCAPRSNEDTDLSWTADLLNMLYFSRTGAHSLLLFVLLTKQSSYHPNSGTMCMSIRLIDNIPRHPHFTAVNGIHWVRLQRRHIAEALIFTSSRTNTTIWLHSIQTWQQTISWKAKNARYLLNSSISYVHRLNCPFPSSTTALSEDWTSNSNWLDYTNFPPWVFVDKQQRQV